jgi:hypothetical protein
MKPLNLLLCKKYVYLKLYIIIMFNINKFRNNTFKYPYTKESFLLYKNVTRQYKDKMFLPMLISLYINN